jgi:hypothetical protein
MHPKLVRIHLGVFILASVLCVLAKSMASCGFMHWWAPQAPRYKYKLVLPNALKTLL